MHEYKLNTTLQHISGVCFSWAWVSTLFTDSYRQPLGISSLFYFIYIYFFFLSLSREELLIFIIMMWLIYVDTLVNARFISQMLHFLSFRDDF